MLNKKSYLKVVLLLLFANAVVAQNSSIKGTVLDNQNSAPIDYASVSLLSSIDSSVVTGTLSKKMDFFLFKISVPENIKSKCILGAMKLVC